MNDKQCISLAKINYKQLKELIICVNEYKTLSGQPITEKDLESLCDLLGGHNLDDELFDLNYGTICATIYLNSGNENVNAHFELSSNVEIWNDTTSTILYSNYEMEEEQC